MQTTPSLPIHNMEQRHHGLTKPIADSYTEAARVCLDRHHRTPTDFDLDRRGSRAKATAHWLPSDARMHGAWANSNDATEAGAYACALAAVELADGLVAVRRAETMTGADYYVALGGNNAELKPRRLKVAVSGMVQYYVTRDEEKEGCEFLIPVVKGFLDAREDFADSNRAYLYNQISMLQHGAGDYEESLTSLKKALELAPDERSYWYNISVTYESMARIDDACEAAVKSIEDQEAPDVDHLAHAIEVFIKAGRTDDVRSAKESLNLIDPARAKFVTM